MKLFAFFCFFLFSTSAFAHPVVYKGGTVYWGTFLPDMNIQRLSYSFTPKLAIALQTNKWETLDNYQDYKLGVNILLKKWLHRDSQGNIYTGMYGGYYNSDVEDGFSSHAMLVGDWESRTLYTAGGIHAYLYDEDIRMSYSYRFGVAPYTAGMGELQSWLIVKLDYFEGFDDNLRVTPMMRFFYNNVLWEIGSSLEGNFFLTLMVHL